jgi:catechol-2,3-dioxygenase
MLFFLDHLVLNVKKLDQSLYFYTEILGLELQWQKSLTGEGPDCATITLGAQKIIFQIYGQNYKPMPRMFLPGTLSIGLKTDLPLKDVRQIISDKGWPVLVMPIKKHAYSELVDLYLRDPDENIIKISNK